MIGYRKAKRLLAACRGRRLLVVGDLMLDRYVSGAVRRISPEAPVPIVHVTGERAVAGGAANVAMNIRSLGGSVVVAGLVGRDREGAELTALLKRGGVSTAGVLTHKGPTTVKTRILAERQQVVRVDREPQGVGGRALDALCRRTARLAGRVDGVIIEDYGKGVVCQPVVEAVLSAVKAGGIPVGLDPKDDHALSFSYLTLATPNYAEACAAAGLRPVPLGAHPERDANLARAGRILLEKWHCDLLIVTLGPQGMYLLSGGMRPRVIPTQAREVYDVSGAGDTVIAAATLALVAGASYRDAAALANAAAGVVVGKLGTATCAPEELLGSLRAAPAGGGAA